MNYKPISDIKIHLKLESLLKEKPIDFWDEQQARTIMWQRYAVAAIFSPIFTEAKSRLKQLLSTFVLYTDGLTPDEIANFCKAHPLTKIFFENDLEK